MEHTPKVEFIDTQLMSSVAEKARVAPRLRMNYNFHRSTDESVNRLLNVMHRGSYTPVHRHLYDAQGHVVERREVGPACDCCGFDIEPGVWHGMVVLEDDTVVFEVKQGPYAPIAKENIAPWTPDSEDVVAVKQFVKELEQSFETDK